MRTFPLSRCDGNKHFPNPCSIMQTKSITRSQSGRIPPVTHQTTAATTTMSLVCPFSLASQSVVIGQLSKLLKFAQLSHNTARTRTPNAQCVLGNHQPFPRGISPNRRVWLDIRLTFHRTGSMRLGPGFSISHLRPLHHRTASGNRIWLWLRCGR